MNRSDLPPWAWFGKPSGAPVEYDWPQIDNPGGYCDYFRCGEPIEAGDSGIVMPLFSGGDEVRRVVLHRDCHAFSLGIGRQHREGEPCNCDEFRHKRGT